MDALVRLGRLRQLVQAAGGEIEGRKKLHKVAYLCQRQGLDLGQDFMFHMYGVFSPSLAEDLNEAKEWKVLSELAEQEPPYETYTIRLGEKDVPGGTDLSDREREILGLAAKFATGEPYVPFGPFLALGAFLVALWPAEVWHFFLRMGTVLHPS